MNLATNFKKGNANETANSGGLPLNKTDTVDFIRPQPYSGTFVLTFKVHICYLMAM